MGWFLKELSSGRIERRSRAAVRSGQPIVLESGMKDAKSQPRFNGVKVFSATMAQERESLGERLTEWIRSRPQLEIVDTIVTQSSDEAFHCLAITLFFWEDLGAK